MSRLCEAKLVKDRLGAARPGPSEASDSVVTQSLIIATEASNAISSKQGCKSTRPFRHAS